MNEEEKILYNFLINDKDFKNLYNEYKDKLILDFEFYINEVVIYCLNSDFNPYLDEKYLDITWLELNNKLYNLEDIFEVFKNNIQEDIKEN